MLAGRMLLKIVYLLVRRIPGLAALISRKDLAKDAELVVLRHENAVLRRRPGPVPAGRPGVLHRAGTAHTPQALGQNLPNYASDVAGLAPQTGREQVRHEQMAHARPPAGSPRASPALSFAWRRRIRCGATTGYMARRRSSA
jgi:hypothetical protein